MRCISASISVAVGSFSTHEARGFRILKVKNCQSFLLRCLQVCQKYEINSEKVGNVHLLFS